VAVAGPATAAAVNGVLRPARVADYTAAAWAASEFLPHRV